MSASSHHNNILNNVFSDFNYEDEDQNHRGNGYETLQIRDPGNKQGESWTRVEGNYFFNLNPETEIISVKSRHNEIRGNAFEASQGGVTLRDGDCNSVTGNVFDGHDKDGSYGVRIFNKHHDVSDNWMMRLREGGLRIGAGEADHVPAENVTMEANMIQDCREAIRLGDGYEEHPREPIVFIQNFVSNESNDPLIEKNPPECQYDFSRGNYFFGSNLGWDNEDEEIPKGIEWDKNFMDLGSDGLLRLKEIKCNAGPSWEKNC